MIKVGDTLPAATLMEYSEVGGEGCNIGPNPVAGHFFVERFSRAVQRFCGQCGPPARPAYALSRAS